MIKCQEVEGLHSKEWHYCEYPANYFIGYSMQPTCGLHTAKYRKMGFIIQGITPYTLSEYYEKRGKNETISK